jgi:hypothetical protein
MLKVSITGIDGVQQTLARLVPDSEAAVRKLAERVHVLAYQGADKHTKKGALIRSLGSAPKKVPGGFVVGHDPQIAPHALFVHWGTRAHDIRPKDKKALRWSIGGRFTFSKFVRHPGYKGDPWLTNAADQGISPDISRKRANLA